MICIVVNLSINIINVEGNKGTERHVQSGKRIHHQLELFVVSTGMKSDDSRGAHVG